MRFIGFNYLWPKLAQPVTQTYRFPRRDRDWEIGERVQVVYKPRSKLRSVLGIAVVKEKEIRWVVNSEQCGLLTPLIKLRPEWDDIFLITEAEAKADGFQNRQEMVQWFSDAYEERNLIEPMNRLMLTWEQVWLYTKQEASVAKRWAEMRNVTTEVKIEAVGVDSK